jgi:TrmH family RNA methyltransferase
MLSSAELRGLRLLRDKKHREELGLFVLEGEKAVRDALAVPFAFEQIYGTEAWPGERTQFVTPEEMARLSHFSTPSSVFAVGRVTRPPLPAGALERGLTLALDGVQDPGNVGTLLRIADWYGLDRVLLSPDCADLFSAKVLQASMGSFARLPVHTVELGAALAGLAVPVLGCDLEGDDVHRLPALREAIIVIGSEGRGLSPAVAARVTRRVTIPRFGAAESLNAAVAAAVVCDNLRRPR